MSRVPAVLINDTSVDRHHGCIRVVQAIYRLSAANGIEIRATAPAHRDWRQNVDFMARFAEARLVLVNGEGTIHHSRPAAGPLLAAGAVAKERGKRSALINFSWFENDSVMAEELVHFDILAARESMSLDSVRRTRPDCRLVPDLSFCGPLADSLQRSGIGFGDSVLADQSAELLQACRQFGGRFIPISSTDSTLSGRLRLTRALLMLAPRGDFYAMARAIRRAIAIMQHEIKDPEVLLAALSRIRLLVTGRFHGVALALCANTPVLTVESNTPKIEALLRDAGLRLWRRASEGQIDECLLQNASTWHGYEQQNVRRYRTMARVEAERLFRDIRDLT